MGGSPRGSITSSTGIFLLPGEELPSELVPALTIAAHPDPARVGDRLLLAGLTAAREVRVSRNEPELLAAGAATGAPLADRFVSRRPIRIARTGDGGFRITGDGGTVLATGGGERADPIEIGPLVAGDGVPITLAGRIVVVLHLVELGADRDVALMGMVGRGIGVSRIRSAVAQLADLRVPVLIRGETGTGKELVARALHAHGPRRGGPFVSVNLASIPKELAAAELFGAVRGAYTGASREREGYFRAARGGTLFLDEIGEAPPEVQVMLLRVLETGELYPVGGDAPVSTDVRVLAATDADLDAQIRDGRFKAPLLHRLAGSEVHLPPLRERLEDLGLLFHHFAREELAAVGEPDRLGAPEPPGDPPAEPWLPAPIMLALLRCRWPGNIRQLRNVTRQLVIGSRGRAQLRLDPRLAAELGAGAVAAVTAGPPAGAATGAITAGPPAAVAAAAAPAAPAAPSAGEDERATIPPPPTVARRRPADVTEPELVAALRASAWDLKAAADLLGIQRASIYNVIARCPNVRTAGDLSPEEIERCYRECAGDVDRMAERLEVSRRALRRRVKELGLGVD